MKPRFHFVVLAAVAAVSACGRIAEMPQPGMGAGRALPATCAGSSAPACRFVNSPVRLEPVPVRLPKRALVFYPTAEELQFVDAAQRDWVAPRKTLTDGASIPQVFVSVIGDPTSREFANAAAMHDAYCGVGNEAGERFHSRDWRSVHRMFHDALRVGGTPEVKAKVMFAAVYIGGPRWGQIREAAPGQDGQAGGQAGGPTGGRAGATGGGKAGDAAAYRGIPAPQMRQILRQTIALIEAENPPLPEIEGFADGLLDAARTSLSFGGAEDAAKAEDGSGTSGAAQPTL